MSAKIESRNWRAGKLEDLVFFQRGFDITQAQQKPGTYPVISSSGITSHHSEFKVSGPGVIIGRKGTLGSIHFTSVDYWPHDTTLWSKDFKGNNPRFVFYFLHTLDFRRLDVGNSNPTLNRNHIHDLSIRIPPLPAQDKVAETLTTYDDLIENNRRRMALLEEAARLLYQEWFVRLRFPGYEHTHIVDGVPEGWEQCTVKDLGNVVTGKTPSTRDADNFEGQIPFIKTPDMHGKVFVIESETYLTDKGANTQAGKFIDPNSIMVTCIGTIGVVAVNSVRSQTNQQINTVVPTSQHWQWFCYFVLKDLKPRMLALGGGATMNNINKAKFESLPIDRPSESLLREFDSIVRSSFDQILNLQLQNQKLKAARDLLLPRLMSGEIPV